MTLSTVKTFEVVEYMHTSFVKLKIVFFFDSCSIQLAAHVHQSTTFIQDMVRLHKLVAQLLNRVARDAAIMPE